MPDVVNVAGIDVGLTLLSPTSGVCRTGPSGDVVDHTYGDYLSRVSKLGAGHSYAVLAIDAPVLPPGVLDYEVRPCEKAFVWGPFQRRCKPGETQVSGNGQALRRGGVETAHAFGRHVQNCQLPCPVPRIFGPLNIAEAFPNAFLGVFLHEDGFDEAPERPEKFDWLYDEWLRRGHLHRLREYLDWPRSEFWDKVARNRQHDERAALVCAMTAIAVVQGQYVAVGEPKGGYFFLPPWELWQPWAKGGLDTNRRDPRLPTKHIEVWIDGERFLEDAALPR